MVGNLRLGELSRHFVVLYIARNFGAGHGRDLTGREDPAQLRARSTSVNQVSIA
jgi:hypothetical protein